MTRRRIEILIGLVPTMAVTFLPLHLWGTAALHLGGRWGGELGFWLLAAILIVYVALVEKRPFSSIGFRAPGILDLVLGVVTGFAMAIGVGLVYTFLFPRLGLHTNTAVMSKLLQTSFFFRVMMVTRAAVSEELLFRGYAIERIAELTGRRWLAALLTVAAFTYAHLASWGTTQLIVAGFGGVLLTALYLWRRNLWANMLAHWIADAIGFLVPH